MLCSSLSGAAQLPSHTHLTQGHVVSTICTCRSDSSSISCTLAPKAGRMTTSPCFTLLKSLLPSSAASINWTSISFRRWFTPA